MEYKLIGEIIILNTFIYLFTIFGIWTLKFIVPRTIRRLRGNKLPKGAITVIGNDSINNKQ
ncbi:MAG: hypothetical protein ACFE88_17145, partial [Candidatus Hermodarchaeota archaeon]